MSKGSPTGKVAGSIRASPKCQDGLGQPYIWVKMREEVHQGARLSEGGGCDRYLGNARIDPATFSVGLP